MTIFEDLTPEEAETIRKLREGVEEHRKQDEATSEKVIALFSASRVTTTVKHSIGDFTLETKATMSKSDRDIVKEAEQISKTVTDIEGIDLVIRKFAEFMAAVCVDSEFQDPEIWVQYHESTGMLADLAMHIFKELTVTPVEIKSFR